MKNSLLKEILSKIDMEYLKDQIEKVKSKDFNKVTEGAAKIIDMVKNNKKLMGFIDEVRTFLSLMGDYIKGNYREIPYKSIAAVSFALLYVLDPFDIIPDFIPGIGYIDDAAVLMIVMKYLGEDISKYRHWKRNSIDYFPNMN